MNKYEIEAFQKEAFEKVLKTKNIFGKNAFPFRNWIEGKRSFRAGLSVFNDEHSHGENCKCKPYWQISISLQTNGSAKTINKWNDKDFQKVRKWMDKIFQGIGSGENSEIKGLFSLQVIRYLSEEEKNKLYLAGSNLN